MNISITDELFIALGFEKHESYKQERWIHNKYKDLVFIKDTMGAGKCDFPKSVEELFTIMEKEISKKSFNDGRSYVQNGLMDLLGVKYEINKIKKCL